MSAHQCILILVCFLVSCGRSQAEHPLQPAVDIARQCQRSMRESIYDYTCTIVRRERIDGKLGQPETIFAKVYHHKATPERDNEPVSIYMRFESPEEVAGREVLFCNIDEDAKVLVRKGGTRLPFLTLSLDPLSRFAMRGNRHPITEFGLRRLAERMAEQGEAEIRNDGCELAINDQAELEGRACKLFEVTHPVERAHFKFHKIRIFIDTALNLPVRFESYGWPKHEGDEPPLDEEYTYNNIRLNVGLCDRDFDRNNPEYAFAR